MSKAERLLQWTIIGLALFGSACAALIICSQPVHASMPQDMTIYRPRFQIISDTFEPNDNFNQPTLPTFVGCSTAPVFQNLTIHPANDQDWFRVSPGVQRMLFVTVTISSPLTTTVADDLALTVKVHDATGVNELAGFSVFTTSPGRSGSTFVYVPVGGFYFVSVRAFNPTQLNQSQFKPYSLQICQSDNIVTPTPPPPPTPTGASPDPYEPNDLPPIVQGQSPIRSFVNVGQQLTNLNFYTQPNTGTLALGDVDWYFFYGRGGASYRVTTEVQPGVDTEMFIYRPDQLPPDNAFTTVGLLASNDDYRPLDRGSQVTFVAPFDGLFWIKIWNKDQAPRVAGQIYNLSVVELAPNTPTPTFTPLPTITPTPFPSGADQYEYNGDFDFATLIAPGVKYSGLNFVPFQPSTPTTVDNDFFRLPVKQGVYYTCETLDLTGGADTNIIVYNQDRIGIGGNDDISSENKALGRFESRFTWLSGYTGYAYILVGEVNPPRANEGQIRGYSLICNIGIPPTPTPTLDPNPPTVTPPPLPPTPLPPEDTPTPFPTPRLAQNLVVRPVDLSVLQPTAAPSPTPRVLLIDVQVFNDFNRNRLLDSGEGIANASVRLSDERSGTPLGQAFTDADGRVRFSVTNDDPVRVAVPLFSFSTVVNEAPATIRIAIEPAIRRPERIP